MHKSIQLIPIVLLFTSFLLAIFTILSSTILFKEQVSLMKLSGNVSSITNNSTKPGNALALNVATIRIGEVVERTRESLNKGGVMVKKSKREINKLSTATNTTLIVGNSVPDPFNVSTSLYIGLMGACYRVPTSLGSNTTTLNCTSASVTPMFTPLFDTLSIPTTLQAFLPNQFPLAPAVIFLSAILLILTALIALIVVVLPITNKAREEKQISMRKLGLILGGISLLAGLAATSALRFELGRFVTEFNQEAIKLGGDLLFSKAELGTGFTQLYAAWSIELAGLILIVLLK